jgi:hypothetical protein
MTLYHDPTYFQSFKKADKPKRCRHTETLPYLAVEWCRNCGSLKYQDFNSDGTKKGEAKWHKPKPKIK